MNIKTKKQKITTLIKIVNKTELYHAIVSKERVPMKIARMGE